MKFKRKNIRAIGEMIVGDVDYFPYRSSKYITQFFEDCDLDFVHDGSTRADWASDQVSELLKEPQTNANSLPDIFINLLRVLMHKSDATENDPDRELALKSLNNALTYEGFEAFYGDDNLLHLRHVETNRVTSITTPHRPLTPKERIKKRNLVQYLDNCSEDDLIENILLPLFRQLGYHRITASGHKDKSLEYGKDIWMKFVLPTQHILYFGIQVKKGKLDSAGVSKGSNSNVAEIYNQLLMMLGHEIFDPETNRRVLVDHAFIIAGGEITKQAKNWIGEKLDVTKRSQILFMDRDDIINLFVTSNLELQEENKKATKVHSDDLPF
ncbi:MAG: hypothetical protein WD607_04470 [Candidatus Paceibacterota bacterium]